ncbi:MAG: hypothetical protein KGJ09_08540, partial [Candidatus Omnitrophica bacterium]|nr:hypothetical protein [Candidatus Omnitrophota bacterium]
QLQLMANGDYGIAKNAGLGSEIPTNPRKYFTVFYACDSLIKNGDALLTRLCNDQNGEDGLLRLVPNDGKELVEFSRSIEAKAAIDLQVVNWGAKGIETSKYARQVPGDIVQTFRNYINSIIVHQVRKRGRDGLLILLDEFDVIADKRGLGSLIKSLSSDEVKFGICGIAYDLKDLVEDHASVSRLLEQGAVRVDPMDQNESLQILERAETLFDGDLIFDIDVKEQIIAISEGYPYFTQMVGKSCVNKANEQHMSKITMNIFRMVLDDIAKGIAFPTLESEYQLAIGESPDRELLLCLLAEQKQDNREDFSRILLKTTRKEAEDFNIKFIDQLIPRLLDRNFGPILRRVPEQTGVYEFVNPVFRLYVKLRRRYSNSVKNNPSVASFSIG